MPTQAELRLSYAPVVKRVAPAVVNVYAAKVVHNRNPLFDDPIFRRFFGVPGGGGSQLQRSLGSGVIVDPAGLVVTNNHVIEGADEVKVSLADKREFEAEIVLKDTRTDLAVLRIKDAHERFPHLEFANSDALQVGDVVLAIGNPFGVGQTVTHGIVSALARTQVGITDYQFFIQTDAAINPGNSGGALVDLDGRLVGINTAIFSRSGGSQGIGFAIPANMVRVVVASAERGGKAVKRPWLGAKLQAVTPEIADSLGLKRPTGALVANVHAATARRRRRGLKAGDLIVAVDGQTVDDPNAFDYRFATKPLGGTARARRACAPARELSVTVALRTAPERRATRSSSARARRSPAPRSPICRRRWPTNCSSNRRPGRRHRRRRRRLATPAMSASSRGDVIVSVNDAAHRQDRATSSARHATRRTASGASSFCAAASRFPRCSADEPRDASRVRAAKRVLDAPGHVRYAPAKARPHIVRRRRPRQRRAAPARRQAAPAKARRGGRAGPSARARRRADPHAGDALARLAGVLGAARHRQDHGGAAAGAGDRPAFRADFRDLHRRRRPEEGVRGGARAGARLGQGTLLFVDEIHRFNRAQQD